MTINLILIKKYLKVIAIVGIISTLAVVIADYYDSITYLGDMLPGQIGRINGTSRIAEEGKDNSGALTYGPYLKLARGKYEVKIKYSATTDESGLWDMVYQGTPNIIKTGKFHGNDKGIVSELITVAREDKDKALEIRIWYTGKGTLQVEDLLIKTLTLPSTILLRSLIGIVVALLCYYGLVRIIPSLDISVRSLSSSTTTIWSSSLTRENKIRYLSTILTIGFIASVIFHYMNGMFYNKGIPFNTFLPPPINRFCDYYGLVDAWSAYSFNGVAYGLSYFPSAYLIVDVFSKIRNPYIAVIPFLFIFVIFFIIYAYNNLQSENTLDTILRVVICSFMSYPILFALHTANIEIYVFMFLCMFVYFYQRGNINLSILFLAMPISMKLYPIVFLVLFISDNKYKEVLYTLLAVLTYSLITLLIFDGGLRNGFSNYLHHFVASQKMYRELMIMGPAGNHYGHSLLNAMQILTGSEYLSADILFPYLMVTMIFFAAISCYIIVYEKDLWKKIILLVVCMNLLPYTSTDYKLLHFFIPLFMFLNHQQEEKLDLLYIVLFSLLLIPKDYYTFYTSYNTLNGVLNAMIMLAILFTIIGSNYIKRSKSDLAFHLSE